MRNSTGYIIELSDIRRQKLLKQITRDAKLFSEPVDDFDVTENKNFICILTYKGDVIMLAEGTRGYPGGTGLRLIDLNCSTIYNLHTHISLESIVGQLPKKVKYYAEKSIKEHRIIPPSTFNEFIGVLSDLDPEVKDVVERYRMKDIVNFLSNLSDGQRQDLAFQKGAISDAMFLSDMKRDELEDWEVPDVKITSDPISYLSGLKSSRLRETEMIHHDLNNLPGFDLIDKTAFESTVFDNGSVRLTVLVTDKKPLEEDLGVDLIYYNEFFKSFVLVQYKAMEDESGRPTYRLPNKQLKKEIQAMEDVLKNITVNQPKIVTDFRLFHNPFFLKLCSRLGFVPDNKDMMQGMYFPLDYWKVLENDPCIIGPHGGKSVTYENIYKKFSNSDFKSLLIGGWIGTDAANSEYLEKVIKQVLQSGKRVIYAVKDRAKNDLLSDEDF